MFKFERLFPDGNELPSHIAVGELPQEHTSESLEKGIRAVLITTLKLVPHSPEWNNVTSSLMTPREDGSTRPTDPPREERIFKALVDAGYLIADDKPHWYRAESSYGTDALKTAATHLFHEGEQKNH